ncbi:hypothetical protein M153_3400005291 [Pseudoloma neurophilia]|uniref:Uncharacterized protein n=1 Tax=Pseudoloma neurophilia TaxID=146866 RepID=A0A0R0M3N4_9MICR|nr:hypothetical protein M153_3400005291 [Pseudoloma neurophilia]
MTLNFLYQTLKIYRNNLFVPSCLVFPLPGDTRHGPCTCNPCDFSCIERDLKHYPILSCYIKCQKNGTVIQKCYCFVSPYCPNGLKICKSNHLLTLEKLKRFSTSDFTSQNIIDDCFEGRDNDLKEIGFYFDNILVKNILNSTLHYSKDNED